MIKISLQSVTTNFVVLHNELRCSQRSEPFVTKFVTTFVVLLCRTNVTPALLHRTGGVINPVGLEAHPCAGAPPPSTEPC